MEPIEARFTTFKRLVADNASGPYVAIMMGMPLGSFLRTVHKHAAEGATAAEMAAKTLQAAGLNPDDFAPDLHDRFNLYIQYFVEASRALYD